MKTDAQAPAAPAPARTLGHLLGLPHDLCEEVALVPCRGCERGQVTHEVLDAGLPEAVVINLGDWQPNPVALHRLRDVHAVIAVEACDEDCASKALQAHRAAAVTLHLVEGQQAEACRMLREEVSRLCRAPVESLVGEPMSLDFSGMRCPLPQVKLAALVKQHAQPGRIVEVVTDDPAFPAEVEAICKRLCLRVLGSEQDGSRVRTRLQVAMLVPPLAVGGKPRAAQSEPAGVPELGHLDLKSLRQPMPIVELAKFAKREKRRGIVVVEAAYPEFHVDLEHWCRNAGAEILQLEHDHKTTRARLMLHARDEGGSKPAPAASAAPAPLPLPEVLLDCRGMACPMPIVTLSKQAKATPAAVIEVVATDGAFPIDVEAWCRQTGAQLLSLDDAGPEYRAVLTPRRAQKAVEEVVEEAALSEADLEEAAEDQTLVSKTRSAASAKSVAAPAPPTTSVVELDCRGMRCPKPVMTLSTQARKTPDTVIRISADDPAFPPDVEAWCRHTGAQLISMTAEGSLHTALVRPRNR